MICLLQVFLTLHMNIKVQSTIQSIEYWIKGILNKLYNGWTDTINRKKEILKDILILKGEIGQFSLEGIILQINTYFRGILPFPSGRYNSANPFQSP